MKAVFAMVAAATLLPWVPSAAALLAGIALALSFGNPFLAQTRRWTTPLLQISVVGLGFGMNLDRVLRAGAHGFAYTAAGILITLVLGLALGRLLKTESEVSLLVTSGTAICGGSAIAAVASAINAPSASTAVALATVFLLNAVALLVFPPIGHWFSLGPASFGLWSALAIHDTSSVVGASLQYGREALEVATTVKLARALWIVPLTFGIAASRGPRSKGGSKKPWFILGFIAAAALVTWVPALHEPGEWIAMGARRALVLTLFLIGANLTRATLASVGLRPFIQGLLLWVLVASASLGAVVAGWVQ